MGERFINIAVSPDDARLRGAVRWLLAALPPETQSGRAARVLIAGEAPLPQFYAAAIARMAAAESGRVLLLDASQGAAALSGILGLPRSPGFAELCQFKTEFETVIRRDAAAGYHFLASGRPRKVGGGWGDPGAADRILRALDESYRCIMLCAELKQAGFLAATFKRQFSRAVLVEHGRSRAARDAFARAGFPCLSIAHTC